MEGAAVNGLDGRIHSSMGRDQDGLALGVVFAHGLEQIQAADAGQTQIADEQIEVLPDQPPQCGFPVQESFDLVSQLYQTSFDFPHDDGLIVHDCDSEAVHGLLPAGPGPVQGK